MSNYEKLWEVKAKISVFFYRLFCQWEMKLCENFPENRGEPLTSWRVRNLQYRIGVCVCVCVHTVKHLQHLINQLLTWQLDWHILLTLKHTLTEAQPLDIEGLWDSLILCASPEADRPPCTHERTFMYTHRQWIPGFPSCHGDLILSFTFN